MIEEANLSPMMQQYMAIKKRHRDKILFFRLGDFYEMFFEDAKLVSRELELTLTGRECGLAERAPMCGVPHHSAEGYVARLIKKGYKVAICEQMEDPAQTKGMVRREVVRVVTPGTVTESAMLDESVNNFIGSIYAKNQCYGLAFSDITTGELFVCDITAQGNVRLKNELGKISPVEIIFNEEFLSQRELGLFIRDKLSCTADLVEEECFDETKAKIALTHQFGAESLEKLTQSGIQYGLPAAAALLYYLEQTQKAGLGRMISIQPYFDRQYMNLDINSRRNLELTETMRTQEKRASLLWVLDKTKTAMGKRLLRSYLEQPLLNPAVINNRLNAVTEFYGDPICRDEIRELLQEMIDLERVMTRVVYGSAGPRELRALAKTAGTLPDLSDKLNHFTAKIIEDIRKNIDNLDDVSDLIENSIEPDPPALLRDGHVIRTGFHPPLDELRALLSGAKDYIAGMEQSEREKTGIRNLKISYNKVFGYYIEVTKSNLASVPDSYIRKQTLVNCERYITQELKELEEKILGAGERIAAMEAHLYEQIRQELAEKLPRIQATANALAQLDVLTNLAHVAVTNNYCCPQVDFSGDIIITEGRHPVVELLSKDGAFIANDTFLTQKTDRVAIITGPNMAGKSTYMRQTALITLMAQIGSYVPAKSAKIGVVDGIFTRVGASDDLASGQSTFMVEMNEVAYILENATAKSLLILDEIGRGTSTFDGMSIARAVVEHIADRKKLGAKTLFATHYHELTELEQCVEGVKNYNVAVLKKGWDITFLRRILPGGTDDSYGIEVSRIAGIPEGVVQRAYEILASLEQNQAIPSLKTLQPRQTVMDGQLTLTTAADHPAIARIRSLDADTLTPREALNVLYELIALTKDCSR